MRIVQVLETLHRGGLERMVLDTSQALRAAGHEVVIACLNEAGEVAEQARAAGIAVHAYRRNSTMAIATIARMVSRFRWFAPDVVHSHNPRVHHFAAIAAHYSRTPCVISTRHSPLSSTGARYDERWYRRVLPWTDRIVYVSEQARRFLTEECGVPEAPSAVIHNGVDCERFRWVVARPAARWPRLRLGAVGRLVPAKGHDILIRAFAAVAGEVPEAELRIIGGGVLAEPLRALVAELRLEGRVSFEGEREDVAPLLGELDLAAFASRSEGLSLAVLEAMAAGLPIVAARAGGTPEVAPEGDVAWYCAPGDSGALAAALRDAMSRPEELQRRGAVARRLAFERHGSDRVAARYAALYREVVDDKRSHES